MAFSDCSWARRWQEGPFVGRASGQRQKVVAEVAGAAEIAVVVGRLQQ